MIIPENRGFEWFRAKMAACALLKPYIGRKWYRVARELYARVFFSAKGLDFPRLSAADYEHGGHRSSADTDFILKYYAKTHDDGVAAFVSMQREARELQSLGWLKIKSETNAERPTLLIRALKFIEEDNAPSAQDIQKKRNAKKSKVVKVAEKQEAVATEINEDLERRWKQLEANVVALRTQDKKAYQSIKDMLIKSFASEYERVRELLKKRIAEDRQRERQRATKIVATPKQESSGIITEKDIQSAAEEMMSVKSTISQREAEEFVKGMEELRAKGALRRQPRRRLKGIDVQKLLKQIGTDLLDLRREENEIVWYERVDKLFELKLAA